MRRESLGRIVERNVVRWLLSVTPKRPHVAVSGFPVNEGNAVEMVRACSARYAGKVFWLVPDVEVARAVLVATSADPTGRVLAVRHRSLRGLWAFLTAEASLFTHGMFGSPRRVRRKIMVNLWHGGGFKGSIMCDAAGRPAIHSDFLVASSSQFGHELARQCQLPEGGLLITGNPRTDQFRRNEKVDLSALGIDGGRPFVVWMPTFRHNKGHGLSASWSEMDECHAASPNEEMAKNVRMLATSHGIDVVVKPHPQDAELRDIEGAVVVSNDDLQCAGIQLYELLGASAGLITDYSSVWIDYLGLDRPIGFVVPDEDGYSAGRGFNPPDALQWLPGPRLHDAESLRAFAEDVIGSGRTTAPRRREVAAHIGHVTSNNVADDILDHLEQRRVFSAPLAPRAPQTRLVSVQRSRDVP